MRVLMATDHYYPYPGGITEHTYHLSRELIRLGIEVEILTSNFPHQFVEEPPDAKNIKVHRVGKSYYIRANKSQTCFSFSRKITTQIKDIIENGNYDIVHSQNSVAPTIPFLSLLYSKSVNFATFHSYHGFSLGYELFKPLLLPVYTKLDGKIFVSKPALETIARHFPIGEHRIIPNGIDVEKFNPEGEKYPFPFEKRDGEIYILFVGRLELRKGTRYLIQAFNTIGKKYTNTRLIIGGDGPLRKSLEKMVKRDVSDRVHFLGFVSSHKLPDLYRSCDIFVSPAIGGESFGIVLLEAMASGKPVIASDNEGYRELVSEGVDGFLFKRKDVAELINKLEILIENPELRHKLGESARLKALNYSWTKIAREVLDYYEYALRKRNENSYH
uniref:Glycosyltransferase family 1 protein n=1 Tax=candidate division WOR-3 bacterium TaxID=2052148 RepID=A0A7C2P1A0_UNCW3